MSTPIEQRANDVEIAAAELLGSEENQIIWELAKLIQILERRVRELESQVDGR